MGIFASIITTLLLVFGLGSALFAGVFGMMSTMLFFSKKSTLKSCISKLALCVVLFILGAYILNHNVGKIDDINHSVLITAAVVAIIAQVFVHRGLEEHMAKLEENQ